MFSGIFLFQNNGFVQQTVCGKCTFADEFSCFGKNFYIKYTDFAAFFDTFRCGRGALVAPWGVLAAAIAAFGFKCKIELTTDEGKVIENASLTLNEDNSIFVVLPAETLIAHSNRITVIATNKADKTPAKDISVTVCEAPKTETEETT